MLCGLTPGPKELHADPLQHFMAVFVDDLLMLFDHGIVVRTPGFPEGKCSLFLLQPRICLLIYSGRRVQLILIAVCCDHPALCRVCGFGDHMTKTFFCTRCKIQHGDLATEPGLTLDGM